MLNMQALNLKDSLTRTAALLVPQIAVLGKGLCSNPDCGLRTSHHHKVVLFTTNGNCTITKGQSDKHCPVYTTNL